MSIQLHELKHQKLSELLRQGMGKYQQCIGRFASDDTKQRCALGAILGAQGWDGKSEMHPNYKLIHTLYDHSIMYWNDHEGESYEQIATRLEKAGY